MGVSSYDIAANYKVCTSTTRPSADAVFGGLLIYETDTKRVLIYDSGAAAWVVTAASPYPPHAHVYRSTAQSFTTAVTASITFDTAYTNVGPMWSAGAPTRLTIPAGWAGWYEVGHSIQWAPNATGMRTCAMRFNSSYVLPGNVSPALSTAGYSTDLQVSVQIAFQAGDYIETWDHQNSGGPLNASASQLVGPNMWATWLCAI